VIKKKLYSNICRFFFRLQVHVQLFWLEPVTKQLKQPRCA